MKSKIGDNPPSAIDLAAQRRFIAEIVPYHTRDRRREQDRIQKELEPFRGFFTQGSVLYLGAGGGGSPGNYFGHCIMQINKSNLFVKK